MTFFYIFRLHFVEQVLLNFSVLVRCLHLPALLGLCFFMVLLLCFLDVWAPLKFCVPACCVLLAPFLPLLIVLVTGFVCGFFLFCICVACVTRAGELLVVFLLLLVLRLGLGVLMSLLCVLCARVHVLCRFACVCRVQIFSFSLLLLRVCVCFVTAPIPLSAPLHLHTHSLLFMQLPDALGFTICLPHLPLDMINPNAKK